jgi:phosphoglycerate dehydrogenase-like enzyme
LGSEIIPLVDDERDRGMPHEVLILSRKFKQAKLDYVNEFLARRDCYMAERPMTYPLDQDQLCDLASTAEGIITGLEWISPRVMQSAPKLKVVSAGGVGYDHIDVAEANKRGIAVGICAGCNNHAVSELAFGMMLNLARDLGNHDHEIKAGGWINYDVLTLGGELWGKTLGIVGLGRVGRSSALLGRAFGMHVLATDIAWDITFANEHGISYVPLDDLLRQSDYVSLHCPLNDTTRSLIDERAIELMKPSAYLINTARGPVVKEAALVNELATQRFAGAGLDVFQVEPHPDNPYTEFTNVILTPHIGGSTQEAFDRSLYLALVNVTNVLNGLPPHCQVNPEVKVGVN